MRVTPLLWLNPPNKFTWFNPPRACTVPAVGLPSGAQCAPCPKLVVCATPHPLRAATVLRTSHHQCALPHPVRTFSHAPVNDLTLHVGVIATNAHATPRRFSKFQQGQLECGMSYADFPQQKTGIWSYGVTVSTLDSESSDRGSNPRRTFTCVHQCRAHGRLIIDCIHKPTGCKSAHFQDVAWRQTP